jgi:hypothetical protein
VFTTARHWSPILIEINPVLNFPSYFSKTHSRIVLPSMFMSPFWFSD